MKVSTATFLDVTQASDKAWHISHTYKLKHVLQNAYYLFLTETSNYYQLQLGVTQGSILGPLLHLFYTADKLTTMNTKITTFTDKTAL
jgi:hypothetical protein